MISAEIMWLLANSDKPLTGPEMSDMTDHNGDYSMAAIRLWRNGFLIRRERKEGGRSPNPYEYAITNREDTQEE